MGKLKDVGAELMISLGVLALSLSAILSVGRRAFLFSDNFADRLAGSLADPRVSAFVASRATDAVIQENPDLTAFRPFILATAQGAVSSASFRALVRSSARAAHASVFSEGGKSVIVSVPDVGVLLKSALAQANPALAEKVPERVRGIVATLGGSRVEETVLRLWRLARRTAELTLSLFVVGVVLCLGGVAATSQRRRGLVRLGLDLLVAGIVLLLLLPAGRAVVSLLPPEPLGAQAAAGLWDAFMGSLRAWAIVLLGVGLVLTAAGQSLLERLDLASGLRRLAAWLESPGGPRLRALRGACLVAAGAAAMWSPGGVVTLLVVLAGVAIAFAGLRELFEIVLRTPGHAMQGEVEAASSAKLRAAVVVTMALVFAAAIAIAGRPPEISGGAAGDACNGSAELCGRRFEDVVFPSTHNSMSSADIPNWLFPQQERGVKGQLEDGIRGLLFDVHAGVPVAGHVKTEIDSGSREKFERAVGKEGLDAAMRIRDRLVGQQEGRRGLYLCHGFCELGATLLLEPLRAMREFLVANPNEVLVLVIEDYVEPAELAAAFEESGLDGLVYRGPARPPWPTLREMIDSRQRVLVLIESGRGGVPWIHPAFEVMQETPYHFKQPSELSCAANRGGSAGSLFLMNNWIDTTPAPKPSNAAIVNAAPALLERARRCEKERGRRPNVVAVDFYRTGGLFEAVRTLNQQPPR